MHILGIDIGGSSLKAAPVDTATGALLAPGQRFATPVMLSPADMRAAVRTLAAQFAWTGPIGLGFPGVVYGNVIRTSANLHPGFIDLDAAAFFRAEGGPACSFTNDADAAGLAEVRFGAGKGLRGTILMLTFGTGVGSALFIDGKLYPNSELGHLPLNGESAERTVSAAAKDRSGESYAVWAGRVSDYLRTLEKILWPELIIIGGGISADHAQWFQYLQTRAPVVPAKFLNEAGIVGAALAAVPAV